MRTYLCVDSSSLDAFTFELPAVRPNVKFELPTKLVPFQFQSILHPGFACKVDVNDVESVDNIKLSNWGWH